MLDLNGVTAATCPAYITAGGKSRRFQSDKALVEIRGEPQLQRLLSMLIHCGHDVQVVAERAEQFANLGIASLVDSVAQAGPAAALQASLEHRLEVGGEGWLLFVACDQLLWSQDWFEQLAESASPGISSVSFVEDRASGKDFRQPIPGIYHTRFLNSLREALAAGERSLRRILKAETTVGVSPRADNPRDWSFNTQAELSELVRKVPS